MHRILREPLLHFLLLGGAIFAAYHWLPQRRYVEPGSIVITRGQIEHLATGFARVWQRPPTDEELAGLVRDRVREEVYYREAIALGLDKDDTVIRRRLRQKMEFISDDVASMAKPTDGELSAYLAAHPDAFRQEPRFSFRQVYLDPELHGDRLARDGERLATELNRAGPGEHPAAAAGDPILLNHAYGNVSALDVAGLFGERFSAALPDLAPGSWQGPVESSYGMHLVLVTERTEGRLPELSEVRDAVRREWENARRLEANDAFYQSLLQRYTVTVEGLGP